MSDSAGYIVQYRTKNGQIQKALMLYADQKPEFTSARKAFLRLQTDELTDKIDPASGRALVSLRPLEDLTRIGFTD